MSLNPEIQCDATRDYKDGVLTFMCNKKPCGNLNITEPIPNKNDVTPRIVTIREIYCQKKA